MSERAIVDFGVAQRNERRQSGRMSNIKEIQERRHSGRMGNIKDIQDHERTISEESRDEMGTEKQRLKH